MKSQDIVKTRPNSASRFRHPLNSFRLFFSQTIAFRRRIPVDFFRSPYLVNKVSTINLRFFRKHNLIAIARIATIFPSNQIAQFAKIDKQVRSFNALGSNFAVAIVD